MNPPPLPASGKSVMMGRVMTLMLPGAGLVYLGRRWTGGLLALAFMACCGTATWWLVQGMLRYYQVAASEAVLQEGAVEQLQGVFPVARLFSMALVIMALQMFGMWRYEVLARRLGLAKD